MFPERKLQGNQAGVFSSRLSEAPFGWIELCGGGSANTVIEGRVSFDGQLEKIEKLSVERSKTGVWIVIPRALKNHKEIAGDG